MRKEVYFLVEGRVQGVMFRQTFIRAAQFRGLKGGATNVSGDRVSCFLAGEADQVQQVMDGLESGRPINSWGAVVDHLLPLNEDKGIPFEQHQVTTENVDSFHWNPNVDMYL